MLEKEFRIPPSTKGKRLCATPVTKQSMCCTLSIQITHLDLGYQYHNNFLTIRLENTCVIYNFINSKSKRRWIFLGEGCISISATCTCYLRVYSTQLPVYYLYNHYYYYSSSCWPPPLYYWSWPRPLYLLRSSSLFGRQCNPL